MNHRPIAIAACFLPVIAGRANAGMILTDFDDGMLQGWSKHESLGGKLTNPWKAGNHGSYLIATDKHST